MRAVGTRIVSRSSSPASIGSARTGSGALRCRATSNPTPQTTFPLTFDTASRPTLEVACRIAASVLVEADEELSHREHGHGGQDLARSPGELERDHHHGEKHRAHRNPEREDPADEVRRVLRTHRDLFDDVRLDSQAGDADEHPREALRETKVSHPGGTEVSGIWNLTIRATDHVRRREPPSLMPLRTASPISWA